MNRKNTGFTLVEILIVVIILGILAAIVIPQFTEASNDARVSAVISDLQTVRSQVELYKIQHLDVLPGILGAAAWSPTTFKTQLTTKTNNLGAAGGTLGPYLQKFPVNPFCADANTGATVVAVAADPGAVVTGGAGWWFNTVTGYCGVNTLKYDLLKK